MSSTLIRWTPEDEEALALVQSRMQATSPGRSLSRPDVLRTLLHLAAARTEIDSATMMAAKPTGRIDK